MSRPKLETCLSPALIDQHDLEGKAVVVIDVFRATTTIQTALEYGMSEVKPVAGLDEAKRLAEQGYLPAAERGGEVAEGFELGNSPLMYRDPRFKDKKLALTTTNGTRAVQLAEEASVIVAGAMRNRAALARFLIEHNRDAVLFCSAWKDRPCLEDTLMAGALADQLAEHFEFGDDPTWMALSVWKEARSDLKTWTARSNHAHRLKGKGMAMDVAWCLELDESDIVPLLRDGAFVVG